MTINLLDTGFVGSLASPMDPDAAAYIAAVEAADGQALEDAMKVAIVNLFRDIKVIPTVTSNVSILAPLIGARTVTGALVPMAAAGGPFIPQNLTSGDYTRLGGFYYNVPWEKEIVFAPGGFNPDPVGNIASMGALFIQVPPANEPLWIHGLLYDNWPNTRGIISFGGGTVVMGINTNDSGLQVVPYNISTTRGRFGSTRINSTQNRNRPGANATNIFDAPNATPTPVQRFRRVLMQNNRAIFCFLGKSPSEGDVTLMFDAFERYYDALVAANIT